MELSIIDGLWWGARVRLDSWKGYQSRLGVYGSQDKPESSDGTVSLIFAPEGRGLEPLTERETYLVEWFVKNESEVSKVVKSALLEWCSPNSQERATNFDFEHDFPAIITEDDLKRYIGLYAVNIHQVDRDVIPYIGYEFGCAWDDEHGAGVLMHGTNLVEVGSADTAILLWIAEQDAQTRN